MRQHRLFTAAFAAALASLLGLGPGAATDLATPPESFQAREAAGAPLPLWLVRYKLRHSGYCDILSMSALPDGIAVLAQDRWGRRVKLYVDAASGTVVPREGYGLAHLRGEEVKGHLAALGYECLAPAVACAEHYEVLARAPGGEALRLSVDPASGAVWHAPARAERNSWEGLKRLCTDPSR